MAVCGITVGTLKFNILLLSSRNISQFTFTLKINISFIMKFCNFLNEISLRFLQIKHPEPIIESKSMGAIFQKKGKKKKDKKC